MDNSKFTLASLHNIKNQYELDANQSGYYSVSNNLVESHNSITLQLSEIFGSLAGCQIVGLVISKNPVSEYYRWSGTTKELLPGKRTTLDQLPFFVKIVAAHKNNFKPSVEMLKLADTIRDICFLGKQTYEYGYSYPLHNIRLGTSNLTMSVEHNGIRFFVVMPISFAEQAFGLQITSDLKLKIANGTEGDFSAGMKILENLDVRDGYSWNAPHIQKFDYTFTTLNAVKSQTGLSDTNLDQLLKALELKKWPIADPGTLSGIKKTWIRLLPIMEEIKQDNPLMFCSYRSLAQACTKSIDGVKISSVFNDVFDKVQTKADFTAALKNFYTNADSNGTHISDSSLELAVKKLDIYKTKRKAVLKSQAGRAFTKIQEEAENLTIDKIKYKKTWAQIEAGNLPIGAFFRKSEQYFLLNDNWDLWEEMFKRGFGDQAIELANEVKGRTTYEKDLMSYFYFVLYGLPEYLKKQTGHKWTCIPKLVNTSEELEPPKEGTDGVARTRSALTPHVDNDLHTVTVPYASLAIYGGRGTTYCYSHDYHVLSRGMSLGGYAITRDVEEKLNGRDDYGLMFYTLTGSAQGRGYPTFLIIFERRERFEDTRVHFHRTHPFRSKDGDYNPLHQWTRGCYNWMAGNIPTNRIKAQQGDLFFVQVKTDANDDLDGTVLKNLAFDHKVNQYDKHCFEREVPFAEYTKAAKSNILGYVNLDQDTWLKHSEHDDVLIPMGTYAIHQCRSWEANPKGVWSLRID